MLINGILKDELGFQGFVFTDWLAHQSGVASALSGLDMCVSSNAVIRSGPELMNPGQCQVTHLYLYLVTVSGRRSYHGRYSMKPSLSSV